MAKRRGTPETLNAQLEKTISTLNKTVEQLNERIAQLGAQLEASAAREAALMARIDALQKARFGKRTEKMPTPREALRRKDRKPDPERRLVARRANAATRAEMSTEIVPHPVPDAAKQCPHCECGELRPMGDGRRTIEYDFVPGYFRRRVHVQEVLACTCGGHIVTAPGPARPFDKCQYGPGLLAHLAVAKCADSFPLYRLEKQFRRLGIPLSRSTMTSLFHRLAELLAPVYDRLLETIRVAPVVLADETPLKIQSLDKRGYVWTFQADGRVAYVFAKTRSGEIPQQILGGTKGVLVVDGYTGYNRVISVDGRTRAACLAHVRRKFFDALGSAPDEAQHALDLILELYRIEQDARDHGLVGTAKHAEFRRISGRPAMARLLAFLRKQRGLHPPKSPLGVAIAHALRNRGALTVFLRDATVPIDNNASERSLRVVALGRKNFLFAGTVEGGENLAVLYSLVATCEAAGVDPQSYLADVVMRVQDHPQARIDELLPHRWATLLA